jgi:hypothetical protein
VLCRNGDAFKHSHVLHSGFFKVTATAIEGREHLVGLHFKGHCLRLAEQTQALADGVGAAQRHGPSRHIERAHRR